MEREQILQLLAQHKPQLAQRYGVLRLALFGSTARDAANAESDIDILVAFDGPATSQRTSACSSTWKMCWAALSI